MTSFHFFECGGCGTTCRMSVEDCAIGDLVPKWCPWDGEPCEWNEIETLEARE